MRWRLLGVALVVIGWIGASIAQTKESIAFDKLRGLSGEWHGTFVWSGARKDSGRMEAHYYTTGNGSAIVEDLSVDGTLSMTSVYHMDGADLRMTHFCAAQNQPRLKATEIDDDHGQIKFSFVDATNMRAPTAGHVSGLEVRFLAADHITLRFQFVAEGRNSDELIDLQRKK